ncbi:hypothetical protein HMI48_05345 [Acidithiobacillus ferrooxidans]|uniref:hypothetical protein n=1 Tax=Acidithiobacillus ferrooxidans TaxID=920 RepID=UPI001C068A5C|nr:hypothetical protein [Acidithiobacillus ferrooxidans]MBU2773349.1 hypothetical protein [Acidithiobacillus ferrooxidans]
MSLVSQLNNRKSNVISFFDEYQDSVGMAAVINLMRSKLPAKELSFSPKSDLVTSSYLGIMSDLLFRMIVGADSFNYLDTIAFQENIRFITQKWEAPLAIKTLQKICGNAFSNRHRFNRLLEGEIFKSLNGTEVAQTDLALQQSVLQKSEDHDYIFKLTTFSVVEAFFRSGKLPKIFTDNITNFLLSNGYIKEITIDHDYSPEKNEAIGCEPRKEYRHCHTKDRADRFLRENRLERVILESYLQFYDSLGGDNFAKELEFVIDNIKKSANDILAGFSLLVSNGRPRNAILVDGADFDVILDNGEKLILVDIKTIRRQITQKDIQQLVSYIFLLGEDDTHKPLTHAGFYYPLTGEFMYYDINSLIKTVLPKFRSVNSARNKFIVYCKRRKT